MNHSRTFVQVSRNIWLILSFYGISLHTINRKGWVGGWVGELSVCQIELHFVIFNLIADTALLSQDCSLIQEAIFSQITFRFLSLKILKHVWGGWRVEGGEDCAVDFGARRGYKCNVFPNRLTQSVPRSQSLESRRPESVRFSHSTSRERPELDHK